MTTPSAESSSRYRSVAEIVARFLVARGVDRVFGLQGGHIQPIWDHLAQLGVRIVDVRDEGAAVHMAHAHAQLSGGVAIAMATAGPGVTNCVTAIAHAHLERVPVLLIGGCPPLPQDDLGPLQGIDHVAILGPVTRHARTLRVGEQIARDLDKAWAIAEGDGGAPGPVYLEIPTDVLRETVHPALVLDEHMAPKSRPRAQPDAALVARAVELLRTARRPLVFTGRGARSTSEALTRHARTLRVAEQIARDLDKAWAIAEGDGGAPGPVYLEIPTDVLRETVHPALVLDEHMASKSRPRAQPDAALVERAAELLRTARRPLVITGRGARGTGEALTRLLDASAALYLDTQESRGLVDGAHASVVGAVRARAMQEADLVLVVGRKLDYQMGYGSPAVFKHAKFIRIADHADELRDNRRGEVELLADAGLAMAALADALGAPSPTLDTAWTAALRADHVKRAAKYAEGMATAPAGKDGHMHPNRIFAALRKALLPDAITIADGGDLLSFARMGLDARTYLDAGAFGCLGVGTPYAVAAALLHPERQVVAITGDGAFGFNAMEIDSAKRHGAKAVFIVSNNAAWNIERIDQEMNYGGRIVGTLLASSDYAAMARAFGLHAERVTDPARLEGAIRDALANAPALIDVVTTQDALSSDAGKGLGWVPDRQALTAWDEAEQKRRT